MNFDKIQKNWKVSLKLKPGTYHYKYIVDGEWTLTKDEENETDLNNIQNHIVVVEWRIGLIFYEDLWMRNWLDFLWRFMNEELS